MLTHINRLQLALGLMHVAHAAALVQHLVGVGQPFVHFVLVVEEFGVIGQVLLHLAYKSY